MQCQKCQGRMLVITTKRTTGHKRNYRCPNCGYTVTTAEVDWRVLKAIKTEAERHYNELVRLQKIGSIE